jgi:hypothetical protein
VRSRWQAALATKVTCVDTEFEAGDAFGAGGTPMAVRNDAEGNVASPLAAGPDSVLALLGARAPSRSGS